jgi:UDP-GlcNAc:undecaprenyl-phosphate/decaprenyl-phosphate GlcNAc-1-phosphate transferase
VRTQIVAFFMSIGIAALVTPAVLRMARKMGLYDSPDGARKIHEDPIPRLGGIAIAAGFAAPLVGLLFYTNTYAIELRVEEGRIIAFFAGFIAILLLGLYDDLRGLGAWSKLTVQCAVGVTLWAGGLSFDSVQFMGESYSFGVASLPMTVVWVAAIVNAMNLIDGLDGLAGGVAFFASVSLFVIAWLDGNPILALFGACLAGAALGFLLYNFEPALIFMGDSGSMVIGYVFASSALWDWGKRATVMALVLPVIALGLPIFDTIFAFGRRAVAGRSPFSSDRGHIHHRLLDAGFSHRQSVLVLYLVCAALTAVVVVVRATDDPKWGAVILGLSVFMFAGGRAMIGRNRRSHEYREQVRVLREKAARSDELGKLQQTKDEQRSENDDDGDDGDDDSPGVATVPLRRVR